MQSTGELERLARGLYRLAGLSPLSDPDLATVAKLVPQGVICLISALAHHGLTTQIPHEVHLALTAYGPPSETQFPPLQVFRFSEQAFAAGIETCTIDGVPVRDLQPGEDTG